MADKAQAQAPQEKGKNNAILAKNQILYRMPQALSTSLIRNHQKQFSTRAQYSPLDEITFDINTSLFVDPLKSFLKFSVAALTATAGTGSGSAMNFIQDVRIQSRSGVELSRTQNANTWSSIRNAYVEDIGTLAEWAGVTGHNGGENNVPTGGVDFVIPLSWLSSFFQPTGAKMLPPHIFSGCRISITLASHSKALFVTGGATTGYSISRPEIVLMTSMMNDNVNKIISLESASSGLEYTYPRIFSSVESSAAATVNIAVKKSVSQAVSVVTGLYPTAAQADVGQDSFLTVNTPPADTTHQYRIGSSYYPQSVVDSNVNAYTMTKEAFAPQRRMGAVTASYTDWTTNGRYVVASVLQTDGTLSSSGIAVNASSSLELSMTTSAVDKTYHTYLIFQGLARGFLNSVSSKI